MSSYPHRPGWKVSGSSSDAAHAIARRAKTLRHCVHSFLIDRHPTAFSADQIADSLGETILSIRPRVSELNKLGLIEAANQRRKNESGMTASCWRAVLRSEERGAA